MVISIHTDSAKKCKLIIKFLDGPRVKETLYDNQNLRLIVLLCQIWKRSKLEGWAIAISKSTILAFQGFNACKMILKIFSLGLKTKMRTAGFCMMGLDSMIKEVLMAHGFTLMIISDCTIPWYSEDAIIYSQCICKSSNLLMKWQAHPHFTEFVLFKE